MASEAEHGGQFAHRDICSADEPASPGVIACHTFMVTPLSTKVGEAQPVSSKRIQTVTAVMGTGEVGAAVRAGAWGLAGAGVSALP